MFFLKKILMPNMVPYLSKVFSNVTAQAKKGLNLLKFLLVLYTAFFAATLAVDRLFVLFLLIIFFSFYYIETVYIFLRVMTKLTFFLVSYIVLGIVFNIDFPGQITFVLRFSLLVLLSVNLKYHLNLLLFLRDIHPLLKNDFCRNLVIFFLGIYEFIHLLKEEFNSLSTSRKKGLDSLMRNVLTAVNSSLEQIDAVQVKCLELLEVSADSSIRGLSLKFLLPVLAGYTSVSIIAFI